MKYTTYYSSIEKIVYEFDKSDIKTILLAHLQKVNDGNWIIENCDDYKNKDDDFPSGWHIELTHNIVKPVEKAE